MTFKFNKGSKENNDTAFLDLLFNCLLVFAVLTILALMAISPAKEEMKKTKAEFIITVTWPLNCNDDVDTWTQDPLGNVVFFKQKELGLMHLDRDDLGSRNDSVVLMDGSTLTFPYNLETTTIRGFVPGEWVLNIHMYRKYDQTPTPVDIKIERLNPTVGTIYFRQIILVNPWEEQTVVRFTMTANGDIINVNQLPKDLVGEKLELRNDPPGPH